MTEWNASGYERESSLQRWLAERSLRGLVLDGAERVLDVGCGNGRITAEIASRLARGSIVGVDASANMIDFAREHYAGTHANLELRVADAAQLSFREEFDLVVSFNA